MRVELPSILIPALQARAKADFTGPTTVVALALRAYLGIDAVKAHPLPAKPSTITDPENADLLKAWGED
jgi:hypothetical protein